MTRWLVVEQTHERGSLMGLPTIVEADTAEEALAVAWPSPPHDRRIWAIHVYELGAEHLVAPVRAVSPEWGDIERFAW